MNLTDTDLLMLRKRAIARWHEYHAQACLPGTAEPLTAEQRTALSWLDACTDFLHVKCNGPAEVFDLDLGIEDAVE